jgi:hypothetical protein
MSGTVNSSGESDNPFELSPAHEQRIRERAYHLWESEGRPQGRAEEYWERARALDAIQSSPPALLPQRLPADPGGEPVGGAPFAPALVEEAALQQNLGEFPGRQADQGEVMATPTTRREARAFRKGAR